MKKATLLFLIVTAMLSFAFVKPNASASKQINIVIDAAHGGYDMGATTEEINEKKIIEQIIHKIKLQNKNKNVVLLFTRSEDKFIPLKDRTDFINTIKPDLVLSLHVNASKNPTDNGLEFYVSKNSKFYEKSNAIAEKFQNKFTASNWNVNEIKNANFFILQKSEAPAIVMEMGYLTNKKDKKLLLNNKEQNQIAKKIIACISELN